MKLSADYRIIIDSVPPQARVLDIGCGDGALMRALVMEKQAVVRGMELSQTSVATAVANGLSVVQGDADSELNLFPDNSVDVVILSRTIQAMRRPLKVLSEMRRIGRRAVISIPNFGHWRVRWALAATGRMPVTGALPTPWHETDNIHLCTLLDLAELVVQAGWQIEAFYPVMRGRAGAAQARVGHLANFLAEEAVFVLS